MQVVRVFKKSGEINEVEGTMLDASVKRGQLVWVDLIDEQPSAFAETMQILSKVAQKKNKKFEYCIELEIPTLNVDEGKNFETIKVSYGPTFIITYRRRISDHLVAQVLASLKNMPSVRSLDVDIVLSRVFEEVAHEDAHQIAQLRHQLFDLEEKAAEPSSGEVINNAHAMNRSLAKVYNAIQLQYAIVTDLLDLQYPTLCRSPYSERHYSRAEKRLERASDQLDYLGRELSEVVGLSNLALTIKLNKITTWLTIVATAILLPNTVGTIFGIPSLPIPSEAWFLVTLSLVASFIAPLIYLRQRGWLQQ